MRPNRVNPPETFLTGGPRQCRLVGRFFEKSPAPRVWADAGSVPTVLDHLILGCSNLDRGIAFVEARTGVRAAFGGGPSG